MQLLNCGTFVLQLRSNQVHNRKMNGNRLTELDRAAHLSRLEQMEGKSDCVALKTLFFLGLTFTPFLIMTFLFIPVLGQLLVGAGVLSTFYYFRLRRAWPPFLAWSLGVLVALTLTALAGQFLRGRLDLSLFVFLALGIPAAIAYLLIVGSLIWRFFNR